MNIQIDDSINLLKKAGSDISEIEFPIRGYRESALRRDDLAKCLNYAVERGFCSQKEAIRVFHDEEYNLFRGIEDALCDAADGTKHII